jgi:hypothetical protein
MISIVSPILVVYSKMFRKKPPQQEINLLELIPSRARGDSINADGLVVVDLPRFRRTWMQKYLVPRNKSPFMKIKLDLFGSRSWQLIDGTRTVNEIADLMAAEFGDEVQPVHERLGIFIRTLRQTGFVQLRHADGSEV